VAITLRYLQTLTESPRRRTRRLFSPLPIEMLHLLQAATAKK
jgi:hypothetical protein